MLNIKLPRRDFLANAGGGFAGIALAQLLGEHESFATPDDLDGGIHHRAKVKRVIQLFMNGGASPMDTFDPKPRLAELNGQKFDPGGGQKVESVTGSPGFKVLQSPFKFRQYGECGRWVSSVFPHVAKVVDELAFLTSMVSKSNVHGLASYMQNTGFTLPGFPCMGAWISYGLGSANRDLPAYVVLTSLGSAGGAQPLYSRLWAAVWPSYPHWNPREPRKDAIVILPDEP